jgi:ATP-dependent RNA circularization protein (DNA/RNA ligase family)
VTAGPARGRRVAGVQGVIKAYDPQTREGVVIRDTDRVEYPLAADALEGSIFVLLRQGQRVVFDLDGSGLATQVRTGAEVDMGLPKL